MVKINERKLAITQSSFKVKTQRFREYLELPASLYQQLENFGVIIEESFLLDWFPEGIGVYTVELLLSDGKTMLFSISTDDLESFSSHDTTDKFANRVRRNKQKPWNSEVIAWAAYLSERDDRVG